MVDQILGMLRDPSSIPGYLCEGRLVPLSKNKGKDQAELKDIRPIVVRSHVAKIMEKAILAKVEGRAPHLLQTRIYQTGFKEGTSTATHVARLLTQIHPGQGRRRRQYAALIDLQKAYDTVRRDKLWEVLTARCRSQEDKVLALLMVQMYARSKVLIGGDSFDADLGVVQGGVLSPMLFNIYLEEALGHTTKLREMIRRGDLLAFADDILILTKLRPELVKTIEELDGLGREWNLRLNKTKSQVLTDERVEEIAGVPCAGQVKYLGVPVCLDARAQREQCVAPSSATWATSSGSFARSTWPSRRRSPACWPGASSSTSPRRWWGPGCESART